MDKKVCENRKKLNAINRVLNLCLICYVIGYIFGGEIFQRMIPVFLIILTALAGGLSYFNRKLPPEHRMSVQLSASSFGIHPYFTFAALLIYDLLFVITLLKG